MNRLSKAIDAAIERSRQRTTIYALMGKRLSDGSYQFVVDGRPDCVWVTMRLSSGAQTTVPAVNSAGIEHSARLAVEMRKEGEEYVILRRSSKRVLSGARPTDPSGTAPHIHDHSGLENLDLDSHPQYYNQTRGDARYYPRPGNVDEDATPFADDDRVLVESDSTGNLVWGSWLNVKAALATYIEGLAIYLRRDGTRTLTANWDIGEDMVILLELLKARDTEGIQIQDSSGNLGIHVADGGNIGFKKLNPTQPVDIVGTTFIKNGGLFVQRDDGTGATIRGDQLSAGTFARFQMQSDVADLSALARGSTNSAVRDGVDFAGGVEFGLVAGTVLGVGATANVPFYLYQNALMKMLINSNGVTSLVPMFVKPGTANDTAKVGGVLFDTYTTVGNVGTGEDDLLSYSVPANALAVNGQSVWLRAFGSLANNANIKKIKVRFGSSGTNLILDTDDMGAVAAGTWDLFVTIYRTGAAAQKAFAKLQFVHTGTTTPITFYGMTSSLNQTLSGAINLRITGEATSNDDITLESCKIGWDGENS